MICAFLLFSGQQTAAEDVLEYYGSKRTFDSQGVTIPSQRRYVDYFSLKMKHGLQYNTVEMFLTAIILEPPPHVGFGHHEAHLQFQVLQHFHEPFQSEVCSIKWNNKKVEFHLRTPLVISGDIKILVRQKMNVDVLHLRNKPKFISTVPHAKLFHFWVNTFFLDKMVSSELTHTVQDHVASEDQATATNRPIPRNKTYSRNLSLFSTRNRFAPLSLPDLKELKDDESSVMTVDTEETHVNNLAPKEDVKGNEISVTLSKNQIDKVSKDHSDRFPENFKVTLIIKKTNVEENGMGSTKCAGTNGRGRD